MKSSALTCRRLPGLAVERRDAVDERLRAQAGGGGVLLHFQAVLVGAGQEVDVVAAQAVPARQRVADDGGVGVAEVRLRRDVIDGSGEEAAHDRALRTMVDDQWRQERVRIRLGTTDLTGSA